MKFRHLFSPSIKKKKEAKQKLNERYSLLDDHVLKLLFVFVGPAVLGLLVNALYNLVDRVFVGRYVGVDGLSAVTMVFPITLLQFGFVLLLGSGAGILIAKHLGEGEPERAETVLGNVIAGLLLTLLVFTTGGLMFHQEILGLLGAEGKLLQLSSEYFWVIVCGFPLAFFIALEFTCRAEGNPHLPAKLILLSSLINASLDYVFMKLLGMGIRGAALATIIAQATNALFLIYYYLSGRSTVKLVWRKIKLQKHIILPILMVGFAPFLMDTAVSVQNIFVNHLLLQSGGNNGVAAMGIIYGINVFFMMIALGTGDGMQPIISFNYGAKRYERSMKTIEYALKTVSIVALAGIVLIELFPLQLTQVFVNGDAKVISITKVALQIFALSIPFYSVQIVMTRYFQALQENKVAALMAITRPILLFVPIAYAFNYWWGLNGIWLAFPVSDGLSALVALHFGKRYSLKRFISL